MKFIINKLLFIFLCTIACSCNLIHFDRNYSNTVNEFPKKFWGKYLLIEKNESSLDTVIMIIYRDSVNYPNDYFLKGGKLDGNIKLAKGKKHYYLCQTDSISGREIWNIYPLKLSGKKLRIYLIEADYYKKYFKRHFKKIDGIDNLYKMDEKAFDRFCLFKLKKKNSIKFIKTE